MNQSKLPDRLHDLASQMPVDLERSAPRTLRRARARRGATALLSSAVVVAVVIAGVAIVRVAAPEDTDGQRPEVPATEGPSPGELVPPSPAPFAGLWPETNPEALAEAQAQVDDGHQPLRLDPEQTAAMLATNVFGWSYEETESTLVATEPLTAVELRNHNFGEDIPPITVELAQLGRTGPDGIWSVLTVTSPLIVGVAVDFPAEDGGSPETIHFQGRLSGLLEGLDVRAALTQSGGGNQPLWGASPADLFFEGSWDGLTDRASAVLWIHVIDEPNDVTLGATAVSLATGAPPTPEPIPTTPSPSLSGLPPDAAVTAQRIYDAAVDHDVDALARLIDPATFVYNFDDALDPVEIWRADPGLLDPIPLILSMTPFVEEVQADRPFHVWPYLMEAGALDEVSEQERNDLHALGFSDDHIAEMQAFGGYLGPRLTIAADGIWLNYVTGGD